MKKKPIVFWGASGHAKAVSDVLKYYPDYEIFGYIDDVNHERQGQLFEGKKILGGYEQLNELKKKGVHDIILGFGHCQRRIEVGSMLKENGFNLPVIIHPRAIVASDVMIGDGVVVLGGAIIDAGCNLGNFTIVNNGAIISHESKIGEGTHVCPGVNIAGRTTIGKGCWLGIGAIIIDKLMIGDFTFIGAGSVVTKNLQAGQLVYGNPAMVIRKMKDPF